MTEISIEAVFAKALIFVAAFLPLEHVLCIHYLIQFKKNQAKIWILLDFGSKINTITLAYIANLNVKVWLTNVEVEKINGSTFKMFKIVLTNFQIKNKLRKSRFFQKTFLVAKTSITIILRMLFLALSNVDVLFLERELTWKSYISAEALPITK